MYMFMFRVYGVEVLVRMYITRVSWIISLAASGRLDRSPQVPA